MDWKRKFFKISLGCLVAAILTSCNNEVDYYKLSVNRMDLNGAKSLVLIKENSTRAIDGNFKSAGLYKIDEDGNMTAVAVYFTQNEDGSNYKESTHSLTIRPRELYDVSENYMIAYLCFYYDKDGDRAYVPYEDLLIRKADGRIWDITKQQSNSGGPIHYYNYSILYKPLELKLFFTESNSGELYYASNDVYKFNLNSSNPSLEQITKNGNFSKNFHIQDNGVIWSGERGTEDNQMYRINIAWPYSGHQSINRDDLYEMEFGEMEFGEMKFGRMEFEIPQSESNDNSIYFAAGVRTFDCSISNKPMIIFNPEIYEPGNYKNRDIVRQFCWETLKPVRADFLKIGDSYNDFKLSNTPIFLQNPPEEFKSSIGLFNISKVYPAEDYILVADDSKRPWLTIIDLKRNEWRWLKQCDNTFGSNAANISIGALRYTSVVYSNKIWSIDSSVDHYGCYWLDLGTFEDGFIPFDFNEPEFGKYENVYPGYIFNENGTFTRQWSSPEDGNNYYLTIDILSGHGEITMEEPDMYYDTLIPLN